MARMSKSRIEELGKRYNLGRETIEREKAKADLQEDPLFEEAVSLRQRLGKMGAHVTIQRALEMVKERKDANNAE
jgi:hypothetical protein